MSLRYFWRMIFVLATVVCALPVASGRAAPDMPVPPPPRVELSGPPGRGAWVVVVPQSSRGNPGAWSVPEGQRALALEGIPSGLALVCAGRTGAATVCQRLVLASGQALSIAPPAPGVRVIGRLLAGRRPITGAKIAVTLHPLSFRRAFAVPLTREGERRFTTMMTTDSDGRFDFPQLAPASYRLILQLPGGRQSEGEPFQVPLPEILRRSQKAPPDASPTDPPVLDLGVLSQPEGAPLEFAVVDRAGRPIAQAGVGVRQGNATSPESPRFEAWAGSEGKVTLDGLDPALVPVHATCMARGFLRWQKTFDSLPATVRCELTRLAGIAGQTVDEDGKPIAGVAVTTRMEEFSAATGKDGRFELSALPPGDHRLLFVAPGWRAAERVVTLVDEEQKRLDPLTLTPAEAWHGKVVDGRTGEPIAGAGVTATDPGGTGSALTDEEGRFSLAADTASGGAVTIEIAASGYPRAPFAVTADQRRADAEEPPVFRLRPGGRIHVSVWDEEADAPCLGCEIVSNGFLQMPTVVTDANGEALSDLLAPGDYRVSLVKAESFGGTVFVSGGSNVRGAKVEPGRTAEVAFGERRAAVEVAFTPEPPPGWKLVVQSPGRREPYERRGDGRFQIRRGAREAVSLSLEGPDSSLSVHQTDLPADQKAPFLRLALPATEVRGALRRGEAPLPGGSVELLALQGGRSVAQTRAGGDGSFALPFVPPGPYLLAVEGKPLGPVEVAAGHATELGAVEAPEPKAAGR